MAYFSQEMKKKIAPVVKSILTKHGLKGSLKVSNHSTLTLTIASGSIDFFEMMDTVSNPSDRIKYIIKDRNFEFHKHFTNEYLSEKCISILSELNDAINEGNWDKSDSMTDYFNCGWYAYLKVGSWDKPYKYTPIVKIS